MNAEFLSFHGTSFNLENKIFDKKLRRKFVQKLTHFLPKLPVWSEQDRISDCGI